MVGLQAGHREAAKSVLLFGMQGHFLVIDPPSAFSALWRMVQPWVDPFTKAKVTFCRYASSMLLPLVPPAQSCGTQC